MSATNSSFAIAPHSNDNPDGRLSRTSSHRHHHQSNDKVNNSSTVLYRSNSRRYSNPFFTSTRNLGARTSIVGVPTTTITAASPTLVHTSQHIQPAKQPAQLSRSVDRLNNKSQRRELRYEEHDDYIPPPLHSIQCHPTNEHYAKDLNQSTYLSTGHRRSQIEVYPHPPLLSAQTRPVLPRPYPSNTPLSHSTTLADFSSMSKGTSERNSSQHTYGRLSDCHSALAPLENSAVKAPRRIESAYGQFPTLTSTSQEPLYANTQSLYDNILYPQSTSKSPAHPHSHAAKHEHEKKSCASQTQLTWTMATFSSFVDLENQSVIIPQPDPTTLYSIVQHYQTLPGPSASPETIEQIKRLSPGVSESELSLTLAYITFAHTTAFNSQ